VEHDAQALVALGLGRQAELRAGRLDALLGAADALGHRRLGHEERAGDLGRRQAADSAQCQRDLRRRRQRRVTAHEQQRQRVVGVRRGALLARRERRGALAVAPGLLAAPAVGQPPGRDREQPARRVLGTPSAGHWTAAAISASWTASSQASKRP
jgi:hypothetical protein